VFPDPRGTIGGPGPRPGRSMGLLGRIVTALVTLGAMVIGLMFSVVIFAVALVLGIGVFGWLWWKMRRALRQARQDPRFQQQFGAAANDGSAARGEIIEGEVIRGEWKDGPGRHD
jgi:hypothetical protein